MASFLPVAYDHSMELTYADQFTIDYYGEDYEVLTIEGTGTYLIVEEDAECPKQVPDDVIVLQKPFEHIYMAATSAMDFYRAIGQLSEVEMTSTGYEKWSIPEVWDAMDAEEMFYIGKYSAPDFEAMLECECDLAVESTMIYHTPEVKEKIEQLGIPVLVEHSSYESHPLGRLEWIKVYGMLMDCEEEAASIYDEALLQVQAAVDSLTEVEDAPTVAFFYIAGDGTAVIRKPGDYVTKMIELMGGTYAFADVVPEEENALSTMKLQMEQFYDLAQSADILIYNSSITGELRSVEDLIALNGVFGDFDAVSEGRVYCTEADMFQSTTAVGQIMLDFYHVISDDEEELTYLYQLK